MIAVETIQFNYDTTAATHDAMNIRRNATQTVTLPEWRRFACITPEDSPAAYSIANTWGNPITIQVSLSSTDPTIHSAEVRVPHHVKTGTVDFAGGRSGPVTFELIDPPVSHGRIGLWDLAWDWEYRLPSHGHHWHHLATTRHRLYAVLEIPTAPWTQTPFSAANAETPWADSLNYACSWAQGAASTDEAAHRKRLRPRTGRGAIRLPRRWRVALHFSHFRFDGISRPAARRSGKRHLRQLQRLRNDRFDFLKPRWMRPVAIANGFRLPIEPAACDRQQRVADGLRMGRIFLSRSRLERRLQRRRRRLGRLS